MAIYTWLMGTIDPAAGDAVLRSPITLMVLLIAWGVIMFLTARTVDRYMTGSTKEHGETDAPPKGQ